VQHGLQAVAGNPTGVSILCLSCHDGSVATNAYGTGTGSVGAANVPLTGRAVIGGFNATLGTGLGDLRNHHPISFDYAQVITDGDTEIRAVGSTMGTKTIADYLVNGKVECSTCHEVHNGPEAVGAKLTLVDDTRSALCLTCHIK